MKPEPFQLERYFAQHEFKAPHLLCCSDCETLTIRELLEYFPGAHDDFLSLRLGYTESLGDPHLRDRISSLYKTVSSEEILVHAGAEEAIFNFMNVVLEAGDQIIVHAPYYQSLGEIARSIGAEVLEAFFSRHGERFDWHPPKAGPISFPRYLGESVEDFCGQLMDDAGVLLLPGTLFGKAYDCFRIGFGRADMEECLSVLEQFIDRQ